VIGAENRGIGLAFQATDQDWSHGTGPAAEGPLLSLVMVMTGTQGTCRRRHR
jgi:hypothetical protein